MTSLRRFAPHLAVVAFLAALAGHLADPGRLLLVRDVPRFNLPLRAALARLAPQGLPEWNPDLAGGQPLLSDPSYAAFYPPTWTLLAVSPAYSISLHVLIHLLIAAFGAYLLVRRLGGRPMAAAFGAIAYAGGGATLSCIPSLNFLPGAAWLPWVLVATESALDARRERGRIAPVLGLAAALAATLLAGEPVTALFAGLAAGLIALDRDPASLPGAVGRVAVATLVATGLAAAQLIPALARLGASIRTGLPESVALGWSLPPARALELIAPRAWGDPMRIDEGLYFGAQIHDRGYPFLVSLYVSLAVVVLAVAALLRWPIPRRRAWLAMTGIGTFLALGQHCPPAAAVLRNVPLLSSVRFPEKFAALALAALVFAAALGLEHLLSERERRPALADFPLGLAAVAWGTVGLLALLVWTRPDDVLNLAIGAGVGARAAPATVLAFARSQASLAFAVASVTLFAVALARIPRIRDATVALALLGVAAADLLAHHHDFLPTTTARRATEPPPLARALDPATRRIWPTAEFDRSAETVAGDTTEARASLAAGFDRLDPWSGMVWGLGYALTSDYGLTHTAAAGRALRIAVELWRRTEREPFLRFLGAWSIDQIVAHKSRHELEAERRAGAESPLPARIATSPYALPHARFVPRAVSHASATDAIGGLLGDGVRLGEREHLVGAPWRGELRFDGAARVLSQWVRGDEIVTDVETSGAALLVLATTWDPGWSVDVDGVAAPALQSVAGYLAVPVPSGARRVRLVYRDAAARVGIAVSLLTLAGLAWLATRRRSSR